MGTEKDVDADEAMDRYARGDEAAFSDLYDALSPRLFGYLRRLTNDQDRAEDLLQQTFLHMHAARGTFLAGAEVVPWSFAIARRLVIDGARRDRRSNAVMARAEPNVLDRVPGPVSADETLHARQTAALLQNELERLPESQRTAFQLVKQDGLSFVQAAEVLGTTVTAVKLRAHRAYLALRGALGAEPGGEETDP